MCGPSQTQKQNSTSTTTPSAAASGLYNNVIGKATDAANNGAYDPATGKSIANFTPDQLAAFQGVQGAQGTGQGNLDAAGNLITQGASAITPEEIANYTNPHQQAVVDAAMAQAQRNNAVAQSTMRGNAASQNALGGNGVQVGQAQLAGEQGRNDNAMVAQLMSQGYDRATALAQADKARQQTGANQQMNLGQLSQNMTYADLQALMASGNAQQGQTQAQNDAASANATAKQMFPYQNAQWLAGIASGVGPLTGGTTTGTGTSTTTTPKGVGQYVGAGLTAASMLSDRRTKENSRIIGKTFDGQNVHEFNYKGSPKRQIGLMADEVRQSHPDAVGQHPSGMEMVDYGRATDDSARRGHFASGGGVGFDGMWNELRPSSPMMPQPMQMQAAAPAAAAPSPSMQESANLGKSARSGIDSILAKLSPSKGWNAGTTIEPTSGGGSLASLGSMLGFAPGGSVDFESFGDTANGRSKRHRLDDQFIGEIGTSGEADPYYGIGPQGEAGGIPASESPWGMSGIAPTYQGKTLADFLGGKAPIDIGGEAMPTQGPDAGAGLPEMPERGYRAPDIGSEAMPTQGPPAASQDPFANPQTATGEMFAPAGYSIGDAGELGNEIAAPQGAPAARAAAPAQRAAAAPAQRAAQRSTDAIVERAMSPDAPAGQPYQGPKDKAVGGLLKNLFGVEFNPLNISENERMAIMQAGLSMMSNGDIGGGGMKGIDFLNKANASDRDVAMDERKERRAERKDERDAASDAQKLKLQMRQLSLAGAGRWSLSPDGTTLVNDASGETRATGAEKAQTDTPAMKEYALAQDQGFKGSFTDFESERKLTTAKGEVPSEVAARIELANGWMNEELPGIRDRAKTWSNADRLDLLAGRGEAAEVSRRMDAGAEALIRMMTGAGKSAEESKTYASRYGIGATDTQKTIGLKLDGLEKDLKRSRKGAITGKTGEMSRTYNAERKAGPALDEARDAIKRGAPRAAVIKRLQENGISATGL